MFASSILSWLAEQFYDTKILEYKLLMQRYMKNKKKNKRNIYKQFFVLSQH